MFINLQLKYCQENPNVQIWMNGELIRVIDALKNFIKKHHLESYTEFLIEQLRDGSDAWKEYILFHLAVLGDTLTPEEVQKTLKYIFGIFINSTKVAPFIEELCHSLIRSLSQVKSEENKPIIFDNIIFDILTKMAMSITSNDQEKDFQLTLKKIKYNLSAAARDKLVDGFLNNDYRLETLHNMFEILTVPQKQKIASYYLQRVKTLKFDYLTGAAKSVEHIQIFKDFFDESLNIYVEHLLILFSLRVDNGLYGSNQILLLRSVLPNDLRKRIMFIFSENKSSILNYLYFMMFNLELLTDDELPIVMKKIGQIIVDLHPEIPVKAFLDLKSIADESNINIEEYLSTFFDDLYGQAIRLTNNDEKHDHSSLRYIITYLALGSEKRLKKLFENYYSALQYRIRIQNKSDKTEQILEILLRFEKFSANQKLLLNDLIKLYFNSYPYGEHPDIKFVCYDFPDLITKKNDTDLQEYLLKTFSEFAAKINLDNEILTDDLYTFYTWYFSQAIKILHGKVVDDEVLKLIKNKIEDHWVPAKTDPSLDIEVLKSQKYKLNIEFENYFRLVEMLSERLEPGVNRIQILPLVLEMIMREESNHNCNCSKLIENIFVNQTVEESAFIREFLVTTIANPALTDKMKMQLGRLYQSYFNNIASTQLTQEPLELLHLLFDKSESHELKIILTYTERSQKNSIIEQTNFIPEVAENVISYLRRR